MLIAKNKGKFTCIVCRVNISGMFFLWNRVTVVNDDSHAENAGDFGGRSEALFPSIDTRLAFMT